MATKFDYKENYHKQLLDSQEFVRYWLGIIQRKMCLKLTSVESSNLQRTDLCDTQEGFEFKWDKKMENSGNFWIEIEEKNDPSQEDYIPSGILRNDNTWIYCIGNFDILYFIPKRTLLEAYRSGKWEIHENHKKSSRGFLLNRPTAQMFSIMELMSNLKDG